MPDITGRTLVIAVQAIDQEIRRMRAVSDAATVPDDDERLLQYELAAEELEAVYAEAAKTIVNLPPYVHLVHRED